MKFGDKVLLILIGMTVVSIAIYGFNAKKIDEF